MPATHQQSPSAATILVVEDDSDTREFLVMVLSMAGYGTLEAASGATALTMLADQPVEAVLLDLRLPDGDGLAVCRHLRGTGHLDLPIILMTADRMADVEQRAQEASVTTVLAKPFAPEVLLERVSSLLQSTSML